MPAANVTCTADALDNYIFPTEGELLWPEGLQITGHLIFLLWLFVGVGLASDTFMNAIEAITSTQKTVRMKDGSTKLVDVWNPTVANLSLMALGSSAPEILLSCVELFTSNMVVGPLGSFTIVGSASFNLFVISAVCTAGMPKGETRLIKQTGVFMTTATFSLVAYIWVVAMVSWWTPGVITIAEAVITFACMPLMLIVAFGADKAETGALQHTRLARGLSAISSSKLFGRQKNGTRQSKRLMFWRAVTGQGGGNNRAAESEMVKPGKGNQVAPAPPPSPPPSPPQTIGGALSLSAVVDDDAPLQGECEVLPLGTPLPLGVGVGGALDKDHHLFCIAPSPVPSPPASDEGGGGGGGDEEDEPELDLMGRLKDAVVGGPPESKLDWALHFFSVLPKVACAFIPNASLLGGYPCFVLSISMVGLITFFVQESARSVSCAMGIPQSVAAITLVALGTSLPDTLASRAAALADETADASVGNITGSNSVNIFLGLGLPWTIGAIYWTAKGLDGMPVPDIGLGYSVLIFEILAVFCLAGFGFRRWRFGYELVGRGKYTTALVFVGFWVLFITLSSIYLMHDIAIF